MEVMYILCFIDISININIDYTIFYREYSNNIIMWLFYNINILMYILSYNNTII